MAGAIERYQKLRLRDALSLTYRYPMACKELGLILRLAYSKSPKPLQSLLLEDTLFAFRLLPLMQTQSAVSAAHLLMQSAAAAFPKQKRVLATTEFKQAKVAHKRLSRTQQVQQDPIQLPQDVLMHLFSFLDMQSLVSAGMVCRSWHAAASDNSLWKFHYSTHFGDSDSFLKFEGLQDDSPAEGGQFRSSDAVHTNAHVDWRDAFKRAYLGLPSWRYKFNRGYCGQCTSIVWLNNLKCPNQHSEQQSGNPRLKPVSPSQIVRYIVDDSCWLMYSSDSDSESDEEELKFWSLSWNLNLIKQ